MPCIKPNFWGQATFSTAAQRLLILLCLLFALECFNTAGNIFLGTSTDKEITTVNMNNMDILVTFYIVLISTAFQCKQKVTSSIIFLKKKRSTFPSEANEMTIWKCRLKPKECDPRAELWEGRKFTLIKKKCPSKFI